MGKPIIEMDSDEMTRIMWAFIKEKLDWRYLDVDLLCYDRSVEARSETYDQIAIDTAEKS